MTETIFGIIGIILGLFLPNLCRKFHAFCLWYGRRNKGGKTLGA